MVAVHRTLIRSGPLIFEVKSQPVPPEGDGPQLVQLDARLVEMRLTPWEYDQLTAEARARYDDVIRIVPVSECVYADEDGGCG